MDEYLGMIKMFAGNYVPQGYMFCAGQILEIRDWQALYSIIGTIYGGDGRATFALPDLRGRMAIGCGQGPGLSYYMIGKKDGQEMAQLGLSQLPVHTHGAVFTPTYTGGSSTPTPITATVTVNAGTAGTPTNDPTGAYWGKSPGTGPVQSQDYTDEKNVTMAPDAVTVDISGGGGITGGTVTVENNGAGESFPILQPYLAINFIICVDGVYPPRN